MTSSYDQIDVAGARGTISRATTLPAMLVCDQYRQHRTWVLDSRPAWAPNQEEIDAWVWKA